ncbi:hypothetical protein [Caballeronia mineralivorans]|jgi:putative protein-disulfide isomerase|uniref:hypothetical protein n=1 Tax=Caballeronia mineralivorans TaxID=2010198 RepID=UPI002B174847|nr:protein-disulfide isomerase [Caballeronia mineralivorans]MEA3104926.1 putative protein-disulfide isomerase [Caballeronia mineralivorans]
MQRRSGNTFTRLSAYATKEHIAESRRLLAQAGGQGFPTFALERGDGQFATLDRGRWPRQPAAWGSHLSSLVMA